MNKLSLEGRIALVTGAGGGMGRSHATLLAERGADVIVHDVKDAIEETAEIVRSKGRRAHAMKVDIRDVTAMQSAIGEAIAGFGPVEILVNNAGVGGPRRSIAEIDQEIFNQMFEVHVRGSFFTTQAVIPGMIERRHGRIVNISSNYAMGGALFSSHYSAAKSAISGFTKGWARELAQHRITVNAVAPGFVMTEMTRGSNTDEQLVERAAKMPLGRFTEAQDISYAVAWLASDESEMITGQVVSPNAGETIVGY